jgi:hypothetical protein
MNKEKENYIPKWGITYEQYFKDRSCSRREITYDKTFTVDAIYKEFIEFCKIYKYVYLHRYDSKKTRYLVRKQEITCTCCNQKIIKYDDKLIVYNGEDGELV